VKTADILSPRLPHSPEAERGLLAGIILGNDGPWLDPSDFFLPFNRELYKGLLRLKQDGKPTDDLVLIANLLDPVELENAGGIAYLASLLDGIAKISNFEHYAQIVKNKAALRRGLFITERFNVQLANGSGNAGEILDEFIRDLISALPRKEVAQKRILPFRTAQELKDASQAEVQWVVKGLAAKGSITELGAKVKAGKTTLLLEMVRAILDGEQFLGLPTLRTPVVYLTEQPEVSFRQAMERANLLGRPDFILLTFGDTAGLPWPQIAAEAVSECQRVGSSLLIVDTLSQFAGLTGDKENNAGDALEAMAPLQSGASRGVGSLITRHERKSGGEVGDSGRGSSAFAGAVDIVLSLRRPEGNSEKTRRVLQSLSRFSETPNDLLVDLQDGRYVALGQMGETVFNDAKKVVFANAPQTEPEALDLQAMVIATKVTRRTAQRAIDELVEEGLLSRIGKGKRGDPFRYFLREIDFCATSNRGLGT
jgi:hypothetical protein